MQRAKQGTNQDKQDAQVKTERQGTGGFPVAKDATQRNEARRTPESRGDRDDHIGGNNQRQQRSHTPGQH